MSGAPVSIREGRHLRLVQTVPDHYPSLYRELSCTETSAAWRSRGRIASPIEFEKLLWHDIAFSCIAIQTSKNGDEAMVGLVELLGLDEPNGHAQLSVAAFNGFTTSGLIVEAVALFLDEVFWRFNLRKVYAMLSDSSMAQCGSMLDRLFEVEGRLTGHVFIKGGYEDVHITSMTRERFAHLTTLAQPLAECSMSPWRLAGSSVSA
jgi:RimJ/RimL family protein N-acetyltransferase